MEHSKKLFRSSWVLNISLLIALLSVFGLEGIHAVALKEEFVEESLNNLNKNRPVLIFLSGQKIDLQDADYYQNLEKLSREIQSQTPNIYISKQHQSQWLKLCQELSHIKNPVALVSEKLDFKVEEQIENCLSQNSQLTSRLRRLKLETSKSLDSDIWKRELASILETNAER
jgi:hypothetical protein